MTANRITLMMDSLALARSLNTEASPEFKVELISALLRWDPVLKEEIRYLLAA